MVHQNFVNIGSGNSLSPANTKPLSGPQLIGVAVWDSSSGNLTVDAQIVQ